MYLEFETRTSYKYLKQVISALEEPVCILGGWAVFLHVNKNFQKAQGRPYLGSRDIDLGFHLNKNATMEQMKKSALSKSLDVLQNKLKFKSVSFRLLKEIHTETEEEIGEGKVIPAHFIFPMYVDVLVDDVPAKFGDVFHFHPADEPLLRFVFEDKKHREELKEFNKKLWLPKPELLLATKLNALKHRDKEHKKIKDVCDIFALLWYSEEKPEELKNKVGQFLQTENIKGGINMITKEDYQKSSVQLNHTPEEVKRVIGMLQ
ncbi:nucleotidyl transferase AbiEii/AbiGii toxin family protein [Candidatus Woesearchaeota archaeon]|nr:nucleotidyl transferase AbiEii/AbiGii toxin family protein [Candidatus Woesearchaeota archaeon]